MGSGFPTSRFNVNYEPCIMHRFKNKWKKTEFLAVKTSRLINAWKDVIPGSAVNFHVSLPN